MTLYTVVIRYSRSKEEVAAVVEAHRAYLDGFVSSGMLLASGPLETADGGVLWVRSENRDALEKMIAGDPYSLAGVADFSVLAFEVKKLAPSISEMMSREIFSV
ncbi:MAG: YciI family protein [Nitrospiraceae bacterium]|nr:YciI family protein [Nitrospiraceae bacterium]